MKKMNARHEWRAAGDKEAAFRRDLVAACKAVDAKSELYKVSHNDEARILLKLEALDETLAKHHRPLRVILGRARTIDIALDMVRHAGGKPSARVKAAVEDLAERHPHPSKSLRHSPEREIDGKLDEWQTLVLSRGVGAPRSRARPDRIDWSGVCEQLECEIEDLDEISERRVRHIDRMVRKPDPLQHIFGNKVNTGFNPAVAPLLRAGVAKFSGGLPEDPLVPGGIDFITIARVSGVSPTDIFLAKEHHDIVEAGRGDKPLVPHPCLAQRVYTYRQLREHGYALRAAEKEGVDSGATLSRRTTGSFDDFLELENAKLGDRVPHDFAARVKRALAAGPSKYGSWWKADMDRWVEYNNDLRARLPLPEDFALTLRVLIAESGIPVADIARGAGTSYTMLNHYMRGLNVPSMQSQPVLEGIAKQVAIPIEVMTKGLAEEWRRNILDIEDDNYEAWMSRWIPGDPEALAALDLDDVIEGLRFSHGMQNTAYARRFAEMKKDKFQLKRKDWTDSMKVAWDAQFPEPKKLTEREKRAARRPGDEVKVEDPANVAGRQKRPPRPATIEFRLNVIRSVLGYFARSRELTPAQLAQIDRLEDSMMTDFRPQSGLGIPLHLIGPALLANHDLISSFIWWRSDRSGAEGPYTMVILALIAQMLRPGTGVVWKNKDGKMLDQLKRFKEWWDENPHDLSEGELKLDLSVYGKTIEEWRAAVETVYRSVVQDMSNVRKRKPVGTRDPFLPISAAIKHARPMERYMRGVYNLLGSKPVKALARHLHVRDCVQTLILIQTGLRVGTMLFEYEEKRDRRTPLEAFHDPNEIKIFRTTSKEKVVTWQIRIGHEVFKNHYGAYFNGGQPYEWTLLNEDDLYDLLNTYVEQSRPYLLEGRESRAFFITRFGTDFEERDISRAHRTVVQRYFLDLPPHLRADGEAEEEEEGWMMLHGPHSVRHVIATHIVKTTGNIHYAAWAIQDSPLTVQKHYARFVPREKLVIAAIHLADARAAARMENERLLERAREADPWRLAA